MCEKIKKQEVKNENNRKYNLQSTNKMELSCFSLRIYFFVSLLKGGSSNK